MILDPIPATDPLIQRSIYMGERWVRWFNEIVSALLSGVQIGVPAVHRSGLSASIAATTLWTPTTPGVVRISLGLQVTTAAAVNSSIAGSLTWVVGGVTQTKAIAALVGNTTTTRDEIDAVIYPDVAQPIRYSTAYLSVGAPAMQYTVTVSAEALP